MSRGKKYTKDEFENKMSIIHGDKYDYSLVDYINNKTKVKVICREHGVFEAIPYNLLNGHGCPKCYGNKKKTTEEFILEANKVHNNFYDYNKTNYTNCYNKIIVTCPIHGEFKVRAQDHLHRKEGCPICKRSSLEIEVSKLLTENKIQFEEQKTFNWLINKNKLYLDFYLSNENIAIECQGRQHFEADEFFGGKEAFDKLIERDRIKKQLCIEHDIKILYFSNIGIEYPYEVIGNKDLLLKQIKHEQEINT